MITARSVELLTTTGLSIACGGAPRAPVAGDRKEIIMFKRSLFFVVALAILSTGCGWWGGGGGGRHYEGHREYHHDHDRR